MMIIITTYLILGTLWSWWLENYTTKELAPPYNQPWTNWERAYHIVLFAYTFLVFVYNIIKEIFKENQQ